MTIQNEYRIFISYSPDIVIERISAVNSCKWAEDSKAVSNRFRWANARKCNGSVIR